MPTGDLMMDVINGVPFAVFYAAFTVMCVGLHDLHLPRLNQACRQVTLRH